MYSVNLPLPQPDFVPPTLDGMSFQNRNYYLEVARSFTFVDDRFIMIAIEDVLHALEECTVNIARQVVWSIIASYLVSQELLS